MTLADTKNLSLAAYPWSERFPNGVTLCDVGGGNGHVLMEVLKTQPTTKGYLQDLPKVVESAKQVSSESRYTLPVIPSDTPAVLG